MNAAAEFPAGATCVLEVACGLGSVWLHDAAGHLAKITFHAPSDKVSHGPTRLLQEARRQLDAWCTGRLKEFDLPLAPAGTPFQQAVWSMLLKIPYGSTCSYGALAAAMGGPAVARAVGMACGANPIPIIIPCHRVLSSTGKLTGYLGGLDWKRWLIQSETSDTGLFGGQQPPASLPATITH